MISKVIKQLKLKFHTCAPLKHKGLPVHDHSIKFSRVELCEAHCGVCGKKLIGLYEIGELSKQKYWVYISTTD